MTTKEKFLTDVKEVMGKYGVTFHSTNTHSVPDGTINNLPNRAITGISVQIPEEQMSVFISGKEFIEFICNKTI